VTKESATNPSFQGLLLRTNAIIMNIPVRFLAPVIIFGGCIFSGCINESAQSVPLVPLDTLTMHKFTRASLLLTGVFEKEVSNGGPLVVVKDTGEIIRFSNYACTWQNNTFSYHYNYHYSSSPTPPYYREDTRDGSNDENSVDSISVSNQITGFFSSSSSAYGKNHWGMVYENNSKSKRIVINSIPLVKEGGDTLVFSMKGQILRDHISGIVNTM